MIALHELYLSNGRWCIRRAKSGLLARIRVLVASAMSTATPKSVRTTSETIVALQVYFL